MHIKEQEAPFTIQVEPTEGCNLGCKFCGLRGMRENGTKPWYFMTISQAERIASEIARVKWTAKIVFAMHGEPTLNPLLNDIIRKFREYLPNNIFHLITNAYGLARDVKSGKKLETMAILERVVALKESGINHLMLDNYSQNGDWSKVVEALNAVSDEVPIYYLDRDKTPMFRSNKGFDVVVLPPIDEVKIHLVRNLKNHAGAAFPPDTAYNNQRCAKMFRELSIRFDGNVAICCDDFRGEYPIANINDMDIEALWNHERFQWARILGYHGERSVFHPCNICTERSTRVGLLPDKMGKETMPKPTEEIRRKAISVSKENKPLSQIVKRSWEK